MSYDKKYFKGKVELWTDDIVIKQLEWTRKVTYKYNYSHTSTNPTISNVGNFLSSCLHIKCSGSSM